jgi:exoribonuclease-2
MNVLYEEDGSFKTGAVIEKDGGALLVESAHKKRSRIKTDKVLLEFSVPAVGELLPQAQTLAESIDSTFLWECMGSEEFGFADLSREYFGQMPSPIETTAVLLRLHAASTHFHRRGRGRFIAATAAELKAAEVAAAKQAEKARRLAEYVEQLCRFELPKELRARLPGLLYKPDANSLEARAVEQAAQKLHLHRVRLLERCGAVADSRAYHVGRFLFEHFPGGREFANVPLFEDPASLPLPRAAVAAFSIDDTTTTEVDDAFSVTPLPDGNYQIGIHIAAPGLGIACGSEADEVARQRLSTVYMPGDKITMLPGPLVHAYSLDEGRECPAVSLYLVVAGDGSFRVLTSDTRVERVPIVANLRYPILDEEFTEEALRSGRTNFPFSAELRVLYELAMGLWTQRGKGEPDKADFQFYITQEAGEERIAILPRKRGAPSDRLVSELMIYVNSTWGKVLGDRDVRALFRVHDGGKVRMSLYPAPHLSLGVSQYLWSSSPLRRYVDLLNQWLLVAVLYGEPSPYADREAELQGVARDFEVTSAAYDEFQRAMERYWSLRYLLQEDLRTTTAVVVKEHDTLVRLERAPLWQRVPSLPTLPAGTVVTLDVSRVDLYDLSVHLEYRSGPKNEAKNEETGIGSS